MTTLTRVQHYLAEFESPDDLAETCRFKRLHGQTACTSHCIVAELIRDQFPEVAAIEVMPGDGLTAGRLWIDGRKGILPAVADSVAIAFDYGLYPDLLIAARVVEPPEDDEEDDEDTDEWEESETDHEYEHGEPVGGVA